MKTFIIFNGDVTTGTTVNLAEAIEAVASEIKEETIRDMVVCESLCGYCMGGVFSIVRTN